MAGAGRLTTTRRGGRADGLKALRNYRKEWDDHNGVWRDKPRHDAASDGADAFRTFATRFREFVASPKPKPKPADVAEMVVGHGGSVTYVEPFSMLEWAERRQRKAERG